MEIAIAASFRDVVPYIGVVFFLVALVALVFVWRSFYAMRIPVLEGEEVVLVKKTSEAVRIISARKAGGTEEKQYSSLKGR